MLKSLKNLLGLSLLGFFGVWIGCSSDSSPVAPYSASKTHTSADTGTTADTDTTYVVFTDHNLMIEVMLALDVPAAVILTRAHLLRLETLKASNKGIKSLSGLEFATNLDTLILSSNSITDVTPLAGLTNLEHLRLYNNKIRDVSSLASLTKLTHLGVGWNHGEVGNALSQLVANMPDLEWLKVNQLGLTDISFLEGLPKLKWLNLSANELITDLSPIACLSNLEYLSVKRMRRGLVGNVADGFNVHIQYLIDKGVTVDALPQYGD